jgi:hypothetical protein
MKSRILIMGGLCLSLALILAEGCGKDEKSPAAPVVLNPTDVAQVVEQAGKLQPLSADKDVVTDTQTHDEGAFRYVTESHDASKNIQEITYLGLNDDVVWTGNLIKGTKVHQFVYEPIIGVARNSVTLSINLEGSGSGTSITEVVSDPMLSTVRQGISNLLQRAIQSGTSYAARAQFDRTQVYSESQVNLAVGADLKYGAGSLNTKFDWASTTRKNKIIAKYQQIYYTIDMDTPATPASVFSSSNTLAGIKAAIPAGSCPMYVAGVTYGMMALTFIETDYTASELNASLDAAYSTGLLDVEIRSGLTKRQVLENSNIKTVVYGGSSAGLGQIETGYQGFIEVVHASIQLGINSPGAPLIYRFRHLCDNTLAQVTLTSQYALTRMIRLQQAIRIVADKFVCTGTGDDCAWDDSYPDFSYFLVKANATQRTSAADPGVSYCRADTVVFEDNNEHEMAVNDEHPMGTSVLLELDAEHFNYEFATIKIYAEVHEHDAFTCPNDADNSFIIIPASEFTNNPHTIELTAGQGAKIRCEVKIEMANRPAGPLAARRR